MSVWKNKIKEHKKWKLTYYYSPSLPNVFIPDTTLGGGAEAVALGHVARVLFLLIWHGTAVASVLLDYNSQTDYCLKIK